MWLVTSLIAATGVTAVYIALRDPKKYNLDWLCLMLWGLAVMVLVDHVIGYIREGGEFIEFTTGGLVPNGTVLGIMMLIPIFTIWEIAALVSKARRAS